MTSPHQAETRSRFKIPRLMMRLARATEAWVVDRRLNINTRSFILERPRDITCFDDGVCGEQLHYFLITKYIQPLKLNSDDVVIDIGCSAGRVVCVFGRRLVRKVIGIEASEGRAAVAEQNARNLRGICAAIEIVTQDAAVFDYTEGTVFWLYNPFGEQTLRCVLDRIREAVGRNRSDIRLAYVNPVHEHLLESSGWLSCFARMRSRLSRVAVSYWSNKAGEIED